MEARIGTFGCAWLATVTGEARCLRYCFGAPASWRSGSTCFQSAFYRYRANSKAFRASRWNDLFAGGKYLEGDANPVRERVKRKHQALAEEAAFPRRLAQSSLRLEPLTWSAPFDNALLGAPKTIMLLLPWMYLGGADMGALRMVEMFARRGYRVTVVCTMLRNPESVELRPEFLKFTHDVHTLPAFLRTRDFPRYIKYLIRSRNIRDVIISNSEFAYEILPTLKHEVPDVRFVDVRSLRALPSPSS